MVVSFTSATMGESAPVSVQWRAMSVSVSASPEYPIAGDAATSTVTLTAAADAPSDATYRWHEWSSGAWTDLGSTSTEQTATSSTRGTRKFRVVASHSVVPSAESEPVYVTWDEWAIVADMIGELSSAVASSTRYTTAEDALLSCMNAMSTTISTSTDPGPKSGPGTRANTQPPAATFASFDDLLANYKGDVKARMEADGDCAATSTAMFSANQSVANEELAALKSGTSTKAVQYAGWLATPQGQHFEANAGDATTLKLFASLLSSQPSDTAEGNGRGSRDIDTSPPTPEPTGFGCLIRAGASPTTQEELDALNCLVFATPHSFWQEHGSNIRHLVEGLPNQLSDSLTIGPYPWFSYGGGDNCTLWPDGTRAACQKHDVMWGSLKKFEGTESAEEWDVTWNPRNKLLADLKLTADVNRYHCDPTFTYLENPWPKFVCEETTPAYLASIMLSGLVFFVDKNPLVAPNWPYTKEDVKHVATNLTFVQCDHPLLNDVTVTPGRTNGGFTFEVSWEFGDGCDQGITISRFSADMGVKFRSNCVLVPYRNVDLFFPQEFRQDGNSVFVSFDFPVSSTEVNAFREFCDTTSATTDLGVRSWPNNLILFSGRSYYEHLLTGITTELSHGQ